MSSPSIPTASNPPERPTAITVICVIGFLGALIVIPLIFSDAAQSIGPWYPPSLALSAVVGFICMVGLWQMRRWAVFLYAGFCVLTQSVLISVGLWSPVSLILPGIVIAISFSQLSKMR